MLRFTGGGATSYCRALKELLMMHVSCILSGRSDWPAFGHLPVFLPLPERWLR